MKKILFIILASSTILILLAIILFIPEKNQCQLEGLLLRQEIMPPGWTVEWYIEPPALPTMGAAHAMNVVFWKNGDDSNIVQNTVYVYRNRFIASFFYGFNDKVFFPTNFTAWTDQKNAYNWNIKSDERKVRCSRFIDPFLTDQCVAVLRNGNIVSDLIVPIGGNVISELELKEMVLYIDRSVHSCSK